MRKNDVLSCPACSTMNTVTLEETSVLCCKNCLEIVATSETFHAVTKSENIPDDWSFIQLGTSGKFNDMIFKIVGRIRLQLRNDYKNFWCAEYSNGKHLWIAESFASISVLSTPWTHLDMQKVMLRAGARIAFDKSKKLTGEYVEKCESITYSGELGVWSLFTPGFFVIQASHSDNTTAMYCVNPGSKLAFSISGKKSTVENLQLTNIIEWNEWK